MKKPPLTQSRVGRCVLLLVVALAISGTSFAQDASEEEQDVSEEEIEKYTEFFNSRKKDSWTAEQVTFLFELYAGVFNKRYNIKRMCSSCMGTANILRGVTGDLDKVYKESI